MNEKLDPRYSWAQVENAILKIPLERFIAALRYGLSEQDGCEQARIRMADDVRRALDAAVKPAEVLPVDPRR